MTCSQSAWCIVNINQFLQTRIQIHDLRRFNRVSEILLESEREFARRLVKPVNELALLRRSIIGIVSQIIGDTFQCANTLASAVQLRFGELTQ